MQPIQLFLCFPCSRILRYQLIVFCGASMSLALGERQPNSPFANVNLLLSLCDRLVNGGLAALCQCLADDSLQFCQSASNGLIVLFSSAVLVLRFCLAMLDVVWSCSSSRSFAAAAASASCNSRSFLPTAEVTVSSIESGVGSDPSNSTKRAL